LRTPIESSNPSSDENPFVAFIAKKECEASHLVFTQYFFRARQNIPFQVNWHHELISDHLERVISGEIKNLVINVPPGSSKTELAVINFIARGLALNPRSRFLHLSYSDDLALLNSQSARDLITSDEFQELWPLRIADDSKAKKRWNIIVDGKPAGGVYATSLAGQITGFRAGHMVPGFQGAIIIDDPLKPEDAFSDTKLNQANRKLLTTVKSRKANPDTPIIMIMQRISQMDPTAFIKTGAVGGEWTHLVIPAVINDAYIQSLKPEFQAKITPESTEKRSYWPYKEKISELLAMEVGEGTDKEGNRIGRHVFASQYQQDPVAVGGNIIRGAWFPHYSILPKIKYRRIFVDTAQKTKERNDFSVFECFGLGEDGKLYLLDILRGKWEAPDLEKRCIAFWQKHKAVDAKELGQLRDMNVEDKASGTGLIQKIKLMNFIPIKPIERTIDKLTRVMDVLGYLESGMVCVPGDAPFTNDFVQECEAFTADNSHAHDDQIDPLVDAVNEMLSNSNKLKVWEQLGKPELDKGKTVGQDQRRQNISNYR
jgi:predicted phage terminase large subunit-like protein